MLFAPIIEWVIRKLGYLPFLTFILLEILEVSSLFPGLSASSFAFFSFGAWLAIKDPFFSQKLTEKKRIAIVIVGAFMLIARYVTGGISLVPWNVGGIVGQIWIWSQMALYWVIALIIAEKTQNVTIWKKLAASGMVIYCMHRIINSKISALGLWLLGKPEISGLEAVVLYFITISLTVAICYTAHLFISKYKILTLLLEGSRKKETSMKNRWLVENSPNSLCEAQILGVPVVASYCGGTPSLVEVGKTGFMYRYEEIEMLAHTIMHLFEQKDFAQLSSNERQTALARHDREINANRLVEIYSDI
jgi:hypothetical protein